VAIEGLDDLELELRGRESESRVAWRLEQRHVARLERASRSRGLTRPDGPFHLRATDYGAVDRLSLIGREDREPEPGQIELRVESAGLNFKDVLFARGLLRELSAEQGIEAAADQPLGMEGLGTVTAVGPGVETVTAGDSAIFLAEGSFADRVRVPADRVVRWPAEEAAREIGGVPVVYATALHAIEDLADLRTGETVLLHAAAGGVGQAAIHVARARGARVIATASRGKHARLRELGVDAVLDSRTLEFRDRILEMTAGQGVPVVLDSIGGDVLAASLDVLALGGRFVEIGRLGVPSAEEIHRRRPDIAWFQFDLSEEFRRRPELATELLTRAAERVSSQGLPAIETRLVPIDEAPSAFEWLGRGRTRGKIVLDLAPRMRHLEAREGASYLITGGLGALGLAFARHLVARGARDLILLGRSAPSEAAQAGIAELQREG